MSVLVALVVWAALTLAVRGASAPLASPLTLSGSAGGDGWTIAQLGSLVVALLVAFGHATAGVASGDSLARAAGELEPPRIRGLRRTMLILTVYGAAVTVAASFLFATLVDPAAQSTWLNAPLLAIAHHVGGPGWLRVVLTIAVVASATLLLGQATRAGIAGAEAMLVRLAQQGDVSRALTLPHARLGTLARASDTAAGVAALAIISSAGRVEWIAHAYAATLAWTLLIKVAVLVRLRRPREESPFRVPVNLWIFGREWPLGLWAIAVAVGSTWLAMLASGDAPTIGASLALAGVASVFAASARRAPVVPADEGDAFRLLPSTELSMDKVSVRPGGVLVTVRNPHALEHVARALDAAADRDVVVMTARLLGVDGEFEDPRDTKPTATERVLFSNIVAMAERYGRTVRLLIVPSYNVFDAISRRRAPAEGVRRLRRRVDDPLRGRAVAAPRRRVGAGRQPQSSTACGWSSITEAAGPTSSTSEPTTRSSRPAISIFSITSGSTPRRRSDHTYTITTWCGRHSSKWRNN